MKVDETFMGVYEWHRVDTDIVQEAATLRFTNWVPSKTSLMLDAC